MVPVVERHMNPGSLWGMEKGVITMAKTQTTLKLGWCQECLREEKEISFGNLQLLGDFFVLQGPSMEIVSQASKCCNTSKVCSCHKDVHIKSFLMSGERFLHKSQDSINMGIFAAVLCQLIDRKLYKCVIKRRAMAPKQLHRRVLSCREVYCNKICDF